MQRQRCISCCPAHDCRAGFFGEICDALQRWEVGNLGHEFTSVQIMSNHNCDDPGSKNEVQHSLAIRTLQRCAQLWRNEVDVDQVLHGARAYHGNIQGSTKRRMRPVSSDKVLRFNFVLSTFRFVIHIFYLDCHGVFSLSEQARDSVPHAKIDTRSSCSCRRHHRQQFMLC